MELKYESKYLHQALGQLVEEMGEAVHAAGKSQRWGLESYNPELGPDSEKNIEWLLRELDDVILAAKVFKAFVKASYNDDKSKWDYVLPEHAYEDLSHLVQE